jgi:hypothetical protein
VEAEKITLAIQNELRYSEFMQTTTKRGTIRMTGKRVIWGVVREGWDY